MVSRQNQKNFTATAGDREAIRRQAGLCASCAHLGVLRSKTSTFVRCGRSDVDERFLRYPLLPTQTCRGHQVVDPAIRDDDDAPNA